MSSVGLQAKVSFLKTGAQSGLKSGVSEAGMIFEEEAKALVPVLTGRLRDNIHTETVTDTDEQQVLMVTPIIEASNKYGFDPAYARRIEFGFIGTDSLGRHYHQAAQPYMRPAFDGKKDEAKDAITNGIYEGLDAAMSLAGGH
jgi:HK97 gp10 family phage protein